MKDTFFSLIEIHENPSELFASDFIQQAVTAWLTNQLNTPQK